MADRTYTTRRFAIVTALVDKLKTIDGSGDFVSDVQDNVSDRLLFWDEVQNWPSIFVVPGDEVRNYQTGGYKDRFLTVTIHCYVQEDFAQKALDALIEDVETIIEGNSRLPYIDRTGTTQHTHDIRITNINTDEGVLEPLGVAQISLEVHY